MSGLEGCATYLMRERDFSAAAHDSNATPVPAIRERDQQHVLLPPKTFQTDRNPASHSHTIRVRGGVGARKYCTWGAIATAFGAALIFVGVPLFIAGAGTSRSRARRVRRRRSAVLRRTKG